MLGGYSVLCLYLAQVHVYNILTRHNYQGIEDPIFARFLYKPEDTRTVE